MDYIFDEIQKQNELHKIKIPEEDVLLEAEKLEGAGKHYIATGVATIDGERYHDFQIEFHLLQEPAEQSLETIMNMDWDWYDFLC